MKYLIWSTKHGGAFWRSGGKGYTENPDIAGRFTEEEAIEICRPSKELSYHIEASEVVAALRRAYMRKKQSAVKSCLETMTPSQVIEILPELIKERMVLFMKGGI